MAQNNQNIRRDAFYCVIYPPSYKKQLEFAGWVRSLSSFNSEGRFDILPLHENFVSTLSGKMTIVDSSGQSREFLIDKALIEASNNLVKVYVNF